MTTAYNLRNKMHRSGLSNRGARLDPGSGGTVIVSPMDRGVVTLTGVGARTLETAEGVGLGTTILCISQTNGITVNGDTINNGAHLEFVVTLDSSGDHQWV